MTYRPSTAWKVLIITGWILIIVGWIMPGHQVLLPSVATGLFLFALAEIPLQRRRLRRRRHAEELRTRAEAEHLAALTPEDREWLREQGWQR